MSLGQTRSAPRSPRWRGSMKKDSLNDVIRADALDRLGGAEGRARAAHRDRMDAPRQVERRTRRRDAMLGRLAKLSEKAKDRAYDRLIELLDDEWLRVRLNAVAALAEMKDTRAWAR